MDIPFLSSTWAPDSSDTRCTSSEQSILQSCTCYSAAECERLNLRAQATQVAPRCRQAAWEQTRATSVSSENVGWWPAHCKESLVRVVWLLTLHHLASLIIYLTSNFFFFFCMMSTNTPTKRKILFWKKSRSTSRLYIKPLSLCDLFSPPWISGARVPSCILLSNDLARFGEFQQF